MRPTPALRRVNLRGPPARRSLGLARRPHESPRAPSRHRPRPMRLVRRLLLARASCILQAEARGRVSDWRNGSDGGGEHSLQLTAQPAAIYPRMASSRDRNCRVSDLSSAVSLPAAVLGSRRSSRVGRRLLWHWNVPGTAVGAAQCSCSKHVDGEYC